MVDAIVDEAGVGPALDSVSDIDTGGVRVRVYGHADERFLVYAHGGGWALGDLDTHDAFCRHLALSSGWTVVAVDYRRAPEARHPAALQDVERAISWLPAGATVAVAGDSAGGHLAALTARRARDAGRPLAAQVLICPVISPAMAYPDLDDYGLSREEMRFFWEAYAPDLDDPALDAAAGNLTGLPPAVVVTAELDVLCAEGERYAAALQAADVPVIAARFQGMNHNFPRKLALFDAAHAALSTIAASLAQLTPAPPRAR
jgi:acetyl esterase